MSDEVQPTRERLVCALPRASGGTAEGFSDESRAWDAFDKWSRLLGADRVRLELASARVGTLAVRPASVPVTKDPQ